MAVRLHLKIGLVPEQDRLESSPDALLVTEPNVGSVSRSKGSLFIVVTCRPGHGGKPREAAALVADTIRREYYYDESAGIPHCLEKAIRNADRRLRHGREGSGLVPGSLGVVVAVVRGHELYVATTGDAEAYLVRQARLLTLPDEERGEGLPTGGDARVDVWRGDIAVGDTLLLVSGNLTRVIGTDELKNAVVTLHPQSAVEHLHHLFMAGGGTGSDGLLAIEATEIALTRSERRPVAVRAPEPLAGAPDRSPIPLADPLVGAASAVQDRAREARVAAGGALITLIDRFTDVLPRRGARYRQITPLSSRREAQRRAALALLSFLGVVLLLGVGIWYLGGALGRDERISTVNAGESALAAAEQRLDQVFGDADLIDNDEDRALRLLREAWTELGKAEQAGVSAGRLRPLREQAAVGLDQLYGVKHNGARTVFRYDQALSPNVDMQDLVRGPDGAAYAIDTSTKSVLRLTLDPTAVVPIITAVAEGAEGIGEPWQLAVGGPDLLVTDRGGRLWRWRPSNAAGGGTLSPVHVGGETAWGRDMRDTGTYLVDAESGLYNFYVLDPSSRQILRYLPAADGSGFPSPPTGYLASETNVSGWRELYIDGDIYALKADGVIRHENGRTDDFELEDPPGADDIRSDPEFRHIVGIGARKIGQLFIWDAAYGRILVFDKENGDFVDQFIPDPPTPAFEDLRGMFVVERAAEQAPLLYWLLEDRLMVSALEQEVPAEASPSPSASESGSPAVGSPAASPSPSAAAP
jgi:hypothetical protein